MSTPKPTAFWLAVTFILGLPLYKLYRLTRRLRGLPGPVNPNFFVGNLVDLRRAPAGARWTVWQKTYGPTYRLTGPLLVRRRSNYSRIVWL
jgi:hypothetical protein